MERLRHIRERAGYTQTELAEESGVAQGTISDIEIGKREPHGRTLRKLAAVLGVRVADFFDDDPTPPKGRGRARQPSKAAAKDRRAKTIERATSTLEGIVAPVEDKLDAGTFDDQDRADLDRTAALITPLLQVGLEAEAAMLREEHPGVYDVGPYAVLGHVIARFVAVVIDAGDMAEAENNVRGLDRHRRRAYLSAA